jgi:hypothetical protein
MLLILIQFLIPFHFAQANRCSPEDLVKQVCQKLKSYDSDFIKMGQDEIIINPHRFEKVYETLDQIREPSKKELARMERLFSEAKAELIKKIENGIPYVQLSSIKKNMVDRINLVQLVNPEDMQMEQKLKCREQKIGAYYNPNNSKIEICPLFYQYPAEALTFSLAHEISHAVDPCAMNNNIYQVSLEQVNQSYESDTDNQKTNGMISFFVNEDEEIFMLDVGPNKEIIKDLFAKQSAPTPRVGAIPHASYPYSDSITCGKKAPAAAKGLDCSHNPQSEIMCDHFGAWTLNSLLPEKLTENQKIALVGGLFPDVCANDPKKKTHGAHYMSSQKRMTEILLKMPGIMEKMNCPPLKENKCFKDFVTSKSTVSPAAKRSDISNQR